MSDEHQDALKRFEEAKFLISFAAACVSLADLDLLEGFYSRASSPQEIALGGVSLRDSLVSAAWLERVRAAQALKAVAGTISPDVASAVRGIVRSSMLSADLVAEWGACPECGERRIDNLVIQDDERILCTSCGHRYELGAAS